MKHLIQKAGEHNCLVYSMSMLLGLSVEELEARLGNKGNEKVWPELPEPHCYRNYHILELIDIAYSMKLAMICYYKEIFLSPTLPYTGAQIPIKLTYTHVHELLANTDALLVTGNHALAWNGTYVLDPNGIMKSLSDVYDNLTMFFLIRKME